VRSAHMLELAQLRQSGLHDLRLLALALVDYTASRLKKKACGLAAEELCRALARRRQVQSPTGCGNGDGISNLGFDGNNV
jgi:hypothetical protein